MAQVFNVNEVFAIGIQIEKNGKDFYLLAKDRTDDSDHKKLFADLAHWESTHIEFFEHLRDNLPKGVDEQIEYDPDNLIHHYLKSIADNQIFVNQQNEINNCKTILDIMKKALDFERDSVVLYSSMKEIIPEKMGKLQIDRIISEELKHVAQLTIEISKFTDI